ncbi:MAG: SDR family oxidoreductase [Pseudomonadota bacterium]
MRLEGKKVLVSAAGQGIGKASTLALAAQGAYVFATDINETTLGEVAQQSTENVETFRLDVLNDEAVQAAAKKCQPDILFNCAGFVHHGNLMDCTDEEWDFAFNLNARAMWKMMQANLPGMVERGTGSIINMSSAVSSVIGVPNRFVYAASKAAVIGMTKSVARDYVTTGVRCNCICPGTVESPSLHERLHATGDYEAAKKAFIARQPMGRIATAEEIAALVVYLASDESAFTTGQEHIIDGGWSALI